ADFDACRGLLKDVMVLSAEKPVVAVAPLDADTAVAGIPWYRQLFVTQRLAYGMGALVVLFCGFLGYLVLQNETISERAATLVGEAENTNVRGPMESQSMMANSNANAVSAMANVVTSTNTASNAAESYERGGGGAGGVSIPTKPSTTGSGAADAAAAPAEDDEVLVLAERGDPSTLAAPPPPSAAVSREEAERETQLRSRQQAIPSAGAPSVTQSGPSRRSLDRDNRAEGLAKTSPGVAADALTTRLFGSKTFDRKDGIWYDRAYTNQPMTNVRRNTAAYRKLDQSVRVLAESLPGVVIVVEKERALRIQ
nr:hypothetical protein [Blastocatellia bacterium]